MELNGVKPQWQEILNVIVHRINHAPMLFVQIHLNALIYGMNMNARKSQQKIIIILELTCIHFL